jgi:hypothetical protein
LISDEKFGCDQVFQGAAYALENGDLLRAASSLLLSAHQFVKICGNVIRSDCSFL